MPITVAPRCESHWQAIVPTPPAAAWNSTVIPGWTAKVRRIRYSTVMPLRSAAAATASPTASGMRTSRSAGTFRASA